MRAMMPSTAKEGWRPILALVAAAGLAGCGMNLGGPGTNRHPGGRIPADSGPVFLLSAEGRAT
jgi:hypothetical protein